MAEHQTEIAGKPADPYKATNLETDVPLEKKIQDLSHFIAHCKFAMMTTRDAATGGLMSRCMSLAAQVPLPTQLYIVQPMKKGKVRKKADT